MSLARLPPVQHRERTWARGSWTLSLRGKLLAMMFGLLLLVLAILFGLYWRA